MPLTACRRILLVATLAIGVPASLTSTAAAAEGWPFAAPQPFVPATPCLGTGDFDEDGTRDYGYDPGDGVSCGELGDFNGDDHTDVLVTVADGAGGAVLRIRYGAGDGTFSWAPGSFGAGRAPRNIAIGDVNCDGIDDVAVARGLTFEEDAVHSFRVDVFRGRSESLPVAAGSASGGDNGDPDYGDPGDDVKGLAVTDLDDDGDGDLVVNTDHRYGGGELSAFENLPGAAFSPPEFIDAGDFDTVTAGDVDGDGRVDVVAAGTTVQSRGDTAIYFNEGDGGLSRVFLGSGISIPPLLGDFNGDGRIDIITRAEFGSPFAVYLNRGSRVFEAAYGQAGYRAGCEDSHPVAAGDFDRDGVDDVLAVPASWPDPSLGTVLYRGTTGEPVYECGPESALTLKRLRARVPQRLVAWRRHAAWFRVRCSADCVVTARLGISDRLQRDAGLERNVVGSATYRIEGGKPRSRRVRVHRAALRAILRVRPDNARRLIRMRLFWRAG